MAKTLLDSFNALDELIRKFGPGDVVDAFIHHARVRRDECHATGDLWRMAAWDILEGRLAKVVVPTRLD